MDPRTEKMLTERAQKVAATPAPLRGPVRVLEDAKRWAKTHGREAKLLAGVGVAVLVVAYYFGVALPAQRADRLETEQYEAQIAARRAEGYTEDSEVEALKAELLSLESQVKELRQASKDSTGANARALVESKFSADAIGRETVALYDSLIGR